MINLGRYSGNGRDLRYRRAKVDYILTGIALIPVLVEWGFIAYRVGAAGMNFGAAGAADGMVALLVFLVLGSSMFLPVRVFNFPFRITEANIARQYVLAIRLCQVLNIVVGCMNLGGMLGKTVPWAVYLYGGGLALVAVAVIAYMVLAFRLR